MTQTFVVEKQGQLIEFESPFELDDACDFLTEFMSFNQFAMKLVTFNRKRLSDKQIAWVHYLATQKVAELEADENDEASEEANGEFLPLVQKMYAAVKSNKRNLKLRLPGITISTVNKGINIGSLYLYENGTYVGKITDKGILCPQGSISEDVRNILEEGNESLLRLAKIFGHETGQCSVCGRALSDSLSVQMGIGPICAKRFN